MELRRNNPRQRRSIQVPPGSSGASWPVESGALVALRPDLDLTVNGSDEVTAWSDQSGNGNDGVIIGTPDYDADGWDTGIPTVETNGTDESIDVAAGAEIDGVRGEFTVAAAVIVQTTGGRVWVGAAGAGDAVAASFLSQFTNTLFDSYNYRLGASARGGTVAFNTKTYVVLKIWNDSGTLRADIFLNGTKAVSGASIDSATEATWDTISFGRVKLATPAYYSKVKYAEIVVFPSALSDVQCGALYTDAAARLGGI